MHSRRQQSSVAGYASAGPAGSLVAPEPRRVLREASVVGREFLYRIMQSVTDAPQDLEGSLAGLSAAGYVR